MAKGTRYPAESRVFHDERTKVQIRQVTTAPAIHHQPFFLIPAYDDAMQWLVFISYRTGSPQIFLEERASGDLVQLTDRDDISSFSIYPSHDGRYVYFTAGNGGWRVHTRSYVEEHVIDLGDTEYAGEGAAAVAGTTALSIDDRWWAIRYSVEGDTAVAMLDIESGAWQSVLRTDVVSHMQFCPDDSNLLFCAGPLTDRVWIMNRDGSQHRRVYARKPEEWITHESWIPGTKELAFVDWPNGIRCVQVETGEEREVAFFNAWHAICNREGTMMVADTNFPDIGIKLFDPRDLLGAFSSLCYPKSSSIGEHWNGPFPYANGPIPVYSPQHTHPHPSFSPDSAYVVYTSDCSGHAEVYEATLPG